MSLGFGRHSGILVPLFSVPSSRSWGVGEIADIPLVARWLCGAGQDLLQLLPINEMALGQRSPYSAMTAMAVDPIFIAVGAVEDFGAAGGEQAMGSAWRRRLAEARRSPVVDYALVRSVKEPALRVAFERFHADQWTKDGPRALALRRWIADQAWWLSDYTLFRALHAREGERPWGEWPASLRDRDSAELDRARRALATDVLYRAWLQWVADVQWQRAKALSRPVALLGDMPFMVDTDSADVWTHADAFRLDVSVGAPPDAFSAAGQNWGLPAYRWDVLAAQDFRWLRDRARRTAALFEGYRIDHLVGFYRTYLFPGDGAPACFTPAHQREQLRLGEQVVTIFGEAGARVIAEDLGTVPEFVRASLAALGVPGYKVLRWERHWDVAGQPYRDPAAYPAASVATSGTHDTEPLAAWWDALSPAERRTALDTPGIAARAEAAGETGDTFTTRLRDILLEALFASGSDFLLLPIQDVFGWRDRINVPASLSAQNWTWRLPWPADALIDHPEASERAGALRGWAAAHSRGRPA
jgi:4-alpha-glucanotransferase